jgi:hypothetical protein
MELGTAATGFQVTRLTEASFIVSTPTRATAGAREEPTGSTRNLALLRQPKATVANPA